MSTSERTVRPRGICANSGLDVANGLVTGTSVQSEWRRLRNLTKPNVCSLSPTPLGHSTALTLLCKDDKGAADDDKQCER